MAPSNCLREIAELRLQLAQANAFAGRQTLRLKKLTEKCESLEVLRRTYGEACDAMAIARDEAQAEAKKVTNLLLDLAAESSDPIRNDKSLTPEQAAILIGDEIERLLLQALQGIQNENAALDKAKEAENTCTLCASSLPKYSPPSGARSERRRQGNA